MLVNFKTYLKNISNGITLHNQIMLPQVICQESSKGLQNNSDYVNCFWLPMIVMWENNVAEDSKHFGCI